MSAITAIGRSSEIRLACFAPRIGPQPKVSSIKVERNLWIVLLQSEILSS
jgi:hypothetical protein